MKKLLFILSILIFGSCNSYGVKKNYRNAAKKNPNIDEKECLICYHKKDGKEVTRRVCGDDQEEKDTMKAQMQAEADALGVELKCKGG